MKLLNIFTNILVLSSMAVSVACNETEERGSEARTINAVIVQQPDTRTSLNGPDANGVYRTVWSPGDQIMVFSGDLACRYILKSGENTNKGVFEGVWKLGRSCGRLSFVNRDQQDWGDYRSRTA